MTVPDLVLVLLITSAVSLDLIYRTIPNKITVSIAATGLVLQVFFNGFGGLVAGIEGLALGIGLLFFFFMIGGIGGGDVKLLGAIGAIKGPSFVFHTFVYGAIWGGVSAVFILLIRKQLVSQLKYLFVTIKSVALRIFSRGAIRLPVDRPPETNLSFAYGVAIALGALTVMICGGNLL